MTTPDHTALTAEERGEHSRRADSFPARQLVYALTTPDLVAWIDWLAAIGYGIDFSSDTDPPCTLRELAKAMHRADPSESVETWEWCVTENTGAFTARAEAVGDDHA